MGLGARENAPEVGSLMFHHTSNIVCVLEKTYMAEIAPDTERFVEIILQLVLQKTSIKQKLLSHERVLYQGKEKHAYNSKDGQNAMPRARIFSIFSSAVTMPLQVYSHKV